MKNQVLIFALFGFVVGALFPLSALPLLLWRDALPFNWASLVVLHQTYPNLLVIDLAPFFLALFSSFVAEKNRQLLQKRPEHHLIHVLADTFVLVAIIVFLSLFLPGAEEINFSVAVPISLLGVLMGAVLYFFPLSLFSFPMRYLGGIFPAIGISLLMLGTGGVQSRYFLLFLLVIIFGVAFHGVTGFVVNGIYAALGLASPILYTPSFDFYVGYLFSTVPIFFLVGFVILEVFEVKRLDLALSEAYAKLERSYEEMKETEAKMIEKEKEAAVSKLAMTAAHEIFNRLTPIIGFAEMLKREISPEDHKYHAVVLIAQQSKEIERIVASMSKLEHLETKTLGGVEIIDLEKKKEEL